MQQDGKSVPADTARQVAPVRGHDADVPRADDAVIDDPLEFFRPATSHADVASYTKAQARANVPLTRIALLARAARSETLSWALFPVAIAAALLWITQHIVHADRLILLGLGVTALLAGVNLLRGAAHAVPDRSLTAIFLASNDARLGAGLFVVGAVLGYLAARHLGGSFFVLGLAGVALAVLYALLPIFLSAVP